MGSIEDTDASSQSAAVPFTIRQRCLPFDMPITKELVQQLREKVVEALDMSDGHWDTMPYTAKNHEHRPWNPEWMEKEGDLCIESPVPVAHGVSSNWIGYMEAVKPENVKALLDEIERQAEEIKTLKEKMYGETPV